MKAFTLTLILLLAFAATAPAQTPRTAKDYIKRAATRYLKGDLDGAIEDYSRALESEPRAAEVYVKRGGARRAKGDLNGAIDDFNLAYDIDPLSVSNTSFAAGDLS